MKFYVVGCDYVIMLRGDSWTASVRRFIFARPGIRDFVVVRPDRSPYVILSMRRGVLIKNVDFKETIRLPENRDRWTVGYVDENERTFDTRIIGYIQKVNGEYQAIAIDHTLRDQTWTFQRISAAMQYLYIRTKF